MKKYLFFLRHYNDIDNIAPAIYFFLERDNNHTADVVIYSQDYDFRNDSNLKFLKEAFGDRFNYKWLGEYFGLNTNKHFNSFRQKNKKTRYYIQKSKELVKKRAEILLPFLFKVKKSIKRTFVTVDGISQGNLSADMIDRGVKQILNESQRPSLVCFDINRTAQVRGLLNALRNNGVKKIICLPVSPLINYNVLREYDFVNLKTDEFFRHHDYSGFDKIGYVDNHFVESFNKLFSLLPFDSTLKNKTKPLGAIRYCPKWIDIREKSLKPLDIKRKGIKVVFFLSRPKSNVNWAEIESVIKLLSQFPEYQILIKHHTRSEAITGKEIAENISYVDENSSALINWAEIVLFWGTSVAIEGYLKNKIMVCLSYVCGNKNLFKYYNAGYIVSCRDDLYEFLEKYKKHGKVSIRYNEEGVKNLLDNDIIPSGNKVVENYLQFMLESEE